MPSEETEGTSPQTEVTPKLGKRGSGHLAVSSSVWVAGLIKPAQRHMLAGRRGRG